MQRYEIVFDYKKFGRSILKAQVRIGISRAEMARRSGVSDAVLLRLERATDRKLAYGCTMDTFTALAGFMNVAPGQYFKVRKVQEGESRVESGEPGRESTSAATERPHPSPLLV